MDQTYCGSVKTRISDEDAARKNRLFNKYVQPYLKMIYKLCMQYSFTPHHVQDNYVEVLTNLYKYIDSYDTSRSIHTWLHIVTKRCVYDLEQRRRRHHNYGNSDDTGDIIDNVSNDEDYANGETSERVMGVENYRELYSDDILWALDQLKPQYRRALIYQTAGYKLKEIADLENKNGALDSSNMETIKSRLFLARKQLKLLLTRDGEKRTTANQTDPDGLFKSSKSVNRPGL